MKPRQPSGPIAAPKTSKGYFLLKMGTWYRKEMAAMARELGMTLNCALYHAVLEVKFRLEAEVRLKRRMGAAYPQRGKVFWRVGGLEKN